VDSLTSIRFSHVQALGLQLGLEQALRRDIRWNGSDIGLCAYSYNCGLFETEEVLGNQIIQYRMIPVAKMELAVAYASLTYGCTFDHHCGPGEEWADSEYLLDHAKAIAWHHDELQPYYYFRSKNIYSICYTCYLRGSTSRRTRMPTLPARYHFSLFFFLTMAPPPPVAPPPLFLPM
jgi:hypothetical protein